MAITQVVEVGGARPVRPKPLRKLRLVLASERQRLLSAQLEAPNCASGEAIEAMDGE